MITTTCAPKVDEDAKMKLKYSMKHENWEVTFVSSPIDTIVTLRFCE